MLPQFGSEPKFSPKFNEGLAELNRRFTQEELGMNLFEPVRTVSTSDEQTLQTDSDLRAHGSGQGPIYEYEK